MIQSCVFYTLLALLVTALAPQSLCVNLTLDETQLHRVFAQAVAHNVSSYQDLSSRLSHQVSSQSYPITGSDVDYTDKSLDSTLSLFDKSCWDSEANLSACLSQGLKCFPLPGIGQLFGLSLTSGDATTNIRPRTAAQQISTAQVEQMAPAVLYSLLSCDTVSTNQIEAAATNGHVRKSGRGSVPTTEATWGYSLLFVTLINLCALTGAFVLPCMRLKSYKIVLIFMVALAVGTLVGSGLLFLIPEAFALVHDDDVGYIWKATTIMGGIYLFYLTEKIMRMINDWRENTASKRQRDEQATEGAITTSFRRLPVDNALAEKDPSLVPAHLTGTAALCGSGNGPTALPSNSSSFVEFASIGEEGSSNGVSKDDMSTSGNGGIHVPSGRDYANGGASSPMLNGHHHSHNGRGEVAPVAYMIIFGDALHNFIDGLSIGSAFTQSIMTGVSVSVAVMCEELPHELGDLAILLNSGMPFKRALAYNFLSALTCYMGTVIGIMLGENTQSHEWIFAIAGGMFLYISLVDMMPEMNSAAESPEGKAFGKMKMFLLQNTGLICGFSIMLLMALYGGNIDFS